MTARKKRAVPAPPLRRARAVKVTGRSRRQSEGDITTVLMRIHAVAQDPNVYLVSTPLPVREPGTPGAPNHYPHWAYTVFSALIPVFGAARQVAATLQDEDTWALFVAGAQEHLGPQAVEGIRPCGPKRHHWNTWLKTYGALHVAPLGDRFRELALEQARRQGMLVPDADADAGTVENPSREVVVVGDGKVMDSPCRNTAGVGLDKTTGEVVEQRVDPAAGLHAEAGDKKNLVWGTKHVSISVRSDGYYGRVVVDLEHCPPTGGEAAVAMKMINRLKDAAGDGMKGVVWDGIFNAKHLDPLMRRGLLVVSPVIAEQAADEKKGKPRIEKSKPLDPAEFDGPGGHCEHTLWGYGGAVVEAVVDQAGQERFSHLKHRLRKVGPNGKTRWYHLVHIPCAVNGDHTDFVVPLHMTDEDRARGFNRPEVLRQVPPSSDEHHPVYRFRPDSESLNSQAQQRFTHNRLPAYGPAKQIVIMLGFALAENAVSRYHHDRRTQPAEEVAAA